MATKSEMRKVMKEAARLRRKGHTAREALKIAWETVGKKSKRKRR